MFLKLFAISVCVCVFCMYDSLIKKLNQLCQVSNDPLSVGSVAKGLNNEHQVDHHVASSILGSDTFLCLHRGAWGGISIAK